MRRWAHVRRCLPLVWLPGSCAALLASSSSSPYPCGSCTSNTALHMARAFLCNSRIQYKSLSQKASADEPNSSNNSADANHNNNTTDIAAEKGGAQSHGRSDSETAPQRGEAGAAAHLVSPVAPPERTDTGGNTTVIQPPAPASTRRVGRRRLRAAATGSDGTQGKERETTSNTAATAASSKAASGARMTRGTRRRLARRAMSIAGESATTRKAHAEQEAHTSEAAAADAATAPLHKANDKSSRKDEHAAQEDKAAGMSCRQHVAPVRVHEPVYYMDYHDGTECSRAEEPASAKGGEGSTNATTTSGGGGAAARVRRPSEAELTAERASITKLFLIADSVDFLFTALPCDRDWVKRYLRRVDNAVLPTNALDAGRLQGHTLGPRRRPGAATSATNNEQPSSSSNSNNIEEDSRASSSRAENKAGEEQSAAGNGGSTGCKSTEAHEGKPGEKEQDEEGERPQGGVEELLQRMVLQRPTSNTIWIHVRDYEQQVPPPHLLLHAGNTTPASLAAAAAETKASEGETRSRRRRRGRKGKAGAAAETAGQTRAEGSLRSEDAKAHTNAASNALSPLDAVLALHAWRQQALERAKQSVARHQKDYQHHTITRVRFHDPAKRDVTVVLGAGSSSTIHEVLADMDGKAQTILSDRGRKRNAASGGEEGKVGGEEEEEDEDVHVGAGPFGRRGRSSSSSLPGGANEDEDAHRREMKKLHKSLKEIVVLDTPETPEEEGLFRLMHPEHAALASLPKWDRHSFMQLPFLLTPLLTVFATCVPRRAGDFSQMYSEHDFLAGGGRRAGEKRANNSNSSHSHTSAVSSSGAETGDVSRVESNAGSSSSTSNKDNNEVCDSTSSHDDSSSSNTTMAAAHNFPLATMSDAQVAEAVRRCGVPPGPRFFTRITVIVEHAELSPTDLVSLAEGSTPRETRPQEGKEEGERSEAAAAAKRAVSMTTSQRVRGKPRRIYCLVSNGSL